MHTLENFDVDGFTVKICPDDSGDHECPLENDNDGVRFITFEKRSTLSGFHEFSEPDEVAPWAAENGFELFPLFKYDHSAVSYRVSAGGNPFVGRVPQGHAEFDSGQTGWVAVRTADYIGGEYENNLQKIAQGQAEAVTTWVNGWYYGFIVEDSDGEHVDSCWGFDDIDYCRTEATEAAKHAADKARKARQSRVKELIRNRVPLDVRAAELI